MRAIVGVQARQEDLERDRARLRREAVDPVELVGPAHGARGELPPPAPDVGDGLGVLELLAEGLPNKAIAVRLHISDQTVKFHVSAISGKLGAKNRTDAVRRAVRRGMITL